MMFTELLHVDAPESLTRNDLSAVDPVEINISFQNLKLHLPLAFASQDLKMQMWF